MRDRRTGHVRTLNERNLPMGKAYEFDGVLYGTEGEFLDALAHEYKTGDKELVVDTLEEYGFSLSDLGVRPGSE